MKGSGQGSRSSTAALAALGLLSTGERSARTAGRLSLRAAAVAITPARAVWRSSPLTPARRNADGALQALVGEGRAQQAALSARIIDAAAIAVAAAAELLFNTPEMEAALDRAVGRALDSPATERIAVQVLDSRLLDELIDRLLVSPELQKIVSHIAESDEVRAALTEQSFGLADELAGQVRTQTSRADDSVERVARRLLRRRARQLSQLGEDEPGT